jgi:S-adenosylmethionine synthetase
MPLPITIAHRLSSGLSEGTQGRHDAYLRPDGKTQVTSSTTGDKAVRIDTVVVSSQHAADISLDSMLAPDVKKHVVDPILDSSTSSRPTTGCW